MEKFIDALIKNLNAENWYGALFIALALPDICGKIENPNDNSGPRYRAWCEKYLVPKYTHRVGTLDQGHEHVFLSAADCYALRCSYLHEGGDDITTQIARQALDRFLFVYPPESGTIHCNQSNQTLQLQVDIFCKDMCDGVKQWLEDNKENQDVQNNMKELLEIRSTRNLRF